MNGADFFQPPTRQEVYQAAEELIRDSALARVGLEPDQPMAKVDRDRLAAMAVDLAMMARRAGLSLEEVLRDVRRSLQTPGEGERNE